MAEPKRVYERYCRELQRVREKSRDDKQLGLFKNSRVYLALTKAYLESN